MDEKLLSLLRCPYTGAPLERSGPRVLEVSVGTGANLPHLARHIGPAGEIIGLDLSAGMMKVARERYQRLAVPVRFVRGDACHLPFASDSFDAVFHFGGLNTFGDIPGALREMVRVARPGPGAIRSTGCAFARQAPPPDGRLVSPARGNYKAPEEYRRFCA